MSLPFVFVTNVASRLAAPIGATDASFTLMSLPSVMPQGRYSFRFGTDQRVAEWLYADYPGSGLTFTDAQRAVEGGNPARAWPAGTPVAHVLTGVSFGALSSIVQVVQVQSSLSQYVRSPADRAYLAANFT